MSKHHHKQKQKAPANPYATDAPGGGVGGNSHGLTVISGAIPCACPESGNVQMMRFELPHEVDPRIIRDSKAWAESRKEKAA